MNATGVLKPVRILYVEDDESNIRLVQRIVQLRPEVELIIARTGETALEAFEQMAPKLVLLDRNLPDMTGDVVLSRLRRLPDGAVPVVMISGDPRPRNLSETGATDYLSKPFDIDKLLAFIDSCVRAASA